ncbi:MAG: hypothetical protein IJD26_01485 [Lachnospiraceae bacterium]|nr:hypothetical protein [Lachnospiraceae bacterium]
MREDKNIMKKVIISLLCSMLFSVVYFVFFSKNLYRAGYIINLYYPGAILLGIIALLILNRKFWKLERLWLAVAIMGLIVLIFAIPLVCTFFWEGQLRDLYGRGYNLLEIASYYREVVKPELK